MTDHRLDVLATYKTHKKCQCPDCMEARRILKEMDQEGSCAQWVRNNHNNGESK
jgi:hypothetical protein